MDTIIRRLSLVFAAGCFGALVNSILVWYMGSMGIPRRFGVALAPAWSMQFLYPRLIWGGIWGLVFLAPAWKSGFWTGVFGRGIIFSIFPTLFQLFYVFPLLLGKGMLGLALGKMTPVFVCFYNAVWGFCTALWLSTSRSES